MRKTLIGLTLSISITLLVAGCGGDGEEVAETDTVSSTTTATSIPDATTTSTVAPRDIPNKTAPQASEENTRLTEVRLARQGDADRVTFQFNGALPGYDIGYATMPPRQDGSGNAVQVAGSAGIAARFVGASGVDLTGGVNQTYTGPARLSPTDTRNIAEVVRVSDYEGQLVWAIGVTESRPFEVSTLNNPSRVVIDIK